MTNTDIETYPRPTTLETEQLKYLANTEFVQPGLRGNMPAILACVATGRAIGVDDMTALRSIYIIDGKPSFAAELMVQLVRRRGHSIVGEVTEGKASIKGRRADNGDEISVTWTLAMAERAGLANKQNWKRYPEAMLWSRAVSQLCRMLFADCFAGATYTSEELEEDQGRPEAPLVDHGVPPADTITEPVPPRPPVTEGPPGPSVKAVRRMHALFRQAGIDDRGDRLTYTKGVIQRGIVTSTEMTAAEVAAVSDALAAEPAPRPPGADEAGPGLPEPPTPGPADPTEAYTDRRQKLPPTGGMLDRLDEYVADGLEHRFVTIQELYVQVGAFRKQTVALLAAEVGGFEADSDRLLWEPLKASLRRDEAGDLLSWLLDLRRSAGLEDDIPF